MKAYSSKDVIKILDPKKVIPIGTMRSIAKQAGVSL